VFETNKSGFANARTFGTLNSASSDAEPFGEAMLSPLRSQTPTGWRQKLKQIDIAPDLGEDIGSLRWFRGLGSLTILSVIALALLPDFGPVYGAQPHVPTTAEFDEARAQMIMPIAFGSDSGRRMAANENVVSLGASPERPSISLTANLGAGDSFVRVLQRAGVAGSEASTVANMVSGSASLSDIAPGTPIAIILGARTAKDAPRPLQSLSFRARFDLNLAVSRVGNQLRMNREVIAVDDTPLRVRGLVGSSLYRSARAAGAPGDAIQNYLKIIAGRTGLTNLQPTDEFDIIVEHKRAATGETKVGDLLYAGIDRDGKANIQMLKWTNGSGSQWFEASGVGQSSGGMGRPVNGPITSYFGARMHPILHYIRMHSGLDFGAPYGAPIYAVTDGVVSFAGHKGGYGTYIKIEHGGNIASGYGHMSRLAASAGQHVRRGQIIGYVGSEGLSTGPHLHYELYRDGRAVNPLSVKFTQRAQLEGADLANFRARLTKLKLVKPGAALGGIAKAVVRPAGPSREIDRLR
jgi:murein DD-endopeptidase MepM/ murein hydrolase activator NlpD